MNGAEALIRTLADCGITVCFANPGTSEMHLVSALAGMSATGQAAEWKLIKTIQVPGHPINVVDFSTLDQENGLMYVSDRSNRGIDVFDTNFAKLAVNETQSLTFTGTPVGGNFTLTLPPTPGNSAMKVGNASPETNM